MQAKHKVGKRRPPDTDVLRCLMIFGVPRGGQKYTKIEKMPSENRSKKRRQKRRRSPQWMVECGGLRAASRNARFLLRKVFAMILETSLYTPPLPAECGGLLLLRSLTRGPPHSTKLLALRYVKTLIRILASSGRTLAIHGRILHQKMQRRPQETMVGKLQNIIKKYLQKLEISLT